MSTYSESDTKRVPAGQTICIYDVPANASISVTPGAGGMMTIFTMVDKNATSEEWPAGAVSATTSDVTGGPVMMIEFRATGADGVASWRY